MDVQAGDARPAGAAPAVPAPAAGTLPRAEYAPLLDALLDKVAAYNPRRDSNLIADAFTFGAQVHEGQVRSSGEPYFLHPIAVADLLADFRLDDATIVTALLHDTVEDTGATRADLAARFGEEIAELVQGVTKLSEIERRDAVLDSREQTQAENFRRLILAVAEDARVLLVKLADRLHNMRTLDALPVAKQERIARETMEVYAALAGRMGMQSIREELEDLAIRVLAPGARTSVLRRFVRLRQEHGVLVIPQLADQIRAELEKAGVAAKVFGRQKRPYSIWRKMEKDKVGFENLSDIAGFRVIVEAPQDCYAALGAIHRRWRIVPGRFKDYISSPKRNGYASLHTTVMNRNGWRLEVQIRTREMHEAAERGVAAHWSYRDGQRASNPYAAGPTLWLKDVLQKLNEGAPPTEFLEHVKLEMHLDQVYCFTPRGEVKGLPRGATVLDFAYAVHTAVGDTCVGARIDGRMAPVWKELRNGQTVEVLRSKGQHPTADWDDMVVTGRAKAAIRRSLRERERRELTRFGEELLKRGFIRAGYELRDEDVERAVAGLDLPDPSALYAAVGASEISAEDALAAADPARAASADIARSEEPAVLVRGAGESPAHRFCPICQPMPFERIVGVPDPDGGALLHRIDCDLLLADEANAGEWLDTFWSEHANATAEYPVSLLLTLTNEPGALGAVCTGIGALDANIADLAIVERRPSYWRVRLDLEVRGARHLHKIVRTLANQARVDHVERVMPGGGA